MDSIVIGGYFFIVTPNTIPIRQQLARPHASERLFSSAGDLYSHSRNCLSGHHADMLHNHHHHHHHRVV